MAHYPLNLSFGTWWYDSTACFWLDAILTSIFEKRSRELESGLNFLESGFNVELWFKVKLRVNFCFHVIKNIFVHRAILFVKRLNMVLNVVYFIHEEFCVNKIHLRIYRIKVLLTIFWNILNCRIIKCPLIKRPLTLAPFTNNRLIQEPPRKSLGTPLSMRHLIPSSSASEPLPSELGAQDAPNDAAVVGVGVVLGGACGDGLV